MTTGQPQPAEGPSPRTAPVAVDPGSAHSDRGPAGSTPPGDPAKGTWLGILAVILGAIGCALLVAPFGLGSARAHIALGFALPGLVLGITGRPGRRRDSALPAVGVVLSGTALGLAAVILAGATPKSSPNTFPDDRTAEVLSHDLDVRLGERHVGADRISVAVTLRNKGLKAASFAVTIQVSGSGGVCEAVVGVDDLAPGASHQDQVGNCSSSAPPLRLDLKVIKAVKE